MDYNKIKALYQSKRYAFYTGNHNLNILVVRNDVEPKPNTYNDTLVIVTDIDNKHTLVECKCTSIPGTHWLNNPMEPILGAGAIAEGQYIGLWYMGKFHGTDALLEKNPIKMYRDNDRDNDFDFDTKSITTGNYCVFAHQSFAGSYPKTVDKSSAGCIVPQQLTDYVRVMEMCKKQIASGLGNSFTLTLIKLSDYNKI